MTFEILQIPRDDEGIRSYVEQYKGFRLYSLKTAPECFGSSYERELAFDDSIWYGRLASIGAVTFVAVQSGHIVSTLTAVKLASGAEEVSATGDPWEVPNGTTESACLHYRFNGMFTLPEARGQGMATTLLLRAIDHCERESVELSKSFSASLVVDADNEAARALYNKCGFVHDREEVFGSDRIVVLLKYTIPVPSTGTQV